METWENLEKAAFLIKNLEKGVEVSSRNDKNLEKPGKFFRLSKKYILHNKIRMKSINF